jgi:hypothetical protein
VHTLIALLCVCAAPQVALLENLDDDATPFPARATMVAEPGARYVSWAQESWYSLMKKDESFACVQHTHARTTHTQRRRQPDARARNEGSRAVPVRSPRLIATALCVGVRPRQVRDATDDLADAL